MNPVAARPAHILPAIALAQFAATSLWFAPNAVMADLQAREGWPPAAVGWLTSAVQLGFIAGTLVFALLAVADRHSPRRVFTACAGLGAVLAAMTAWLPLDLPGHLALRLATGFLLAGVYPVGMKIAAGWYPEGLGWALGVLVGALVLGTAAPFGLRALGAAWPWEQVMLAVGVFAAAGAALMAAAVPDGPHLARAARVDIRALALIWQQRSVRAPAFGYFGHMWELYAFLVLVPFLVAVRWPEASPAGQAAFSFAVIAAGGVACVLGGLASRRLPGPWVAAGFLAGSAACGLAAPWMLEAPAGVWAAWMLAWGFTVAGDSPQFSALTARAAPRDRVGSVLTFVNCVGFAISVATILAFTWAVQHAPLAVVLPALAIGPLLGLWAMWTWREPKPVQTPA